MQEIENHKELFKKDLNSYAVIDSVAIPMLLANIHKHSVPFLCLYRGEIPIDRVDIVPYIVKLNKNSQFCNWLIEASTKTPCCIYLNSSENITDVRKHLRKFIKAEIPSGKTIYFRFYDPRILKVYLPECELDDERVVYGEIIEEYYIYNINTERMDSFRPKHIL